jgi:hypothetical protein
VALLGTCPSVSRDDAGILPPAKADTISASARRSDLYFPLAGGEMVSQGSLEPLFQVRILARQPPPRRNFAPSQTR